MSWRSGVSVLIPETDIKHRVSQLGRQITRHYTGGTKLRVVSVLKGSFVFYSDLVREIDLPVECDFVRASSYGDAKKSSGKVSDVELKEHEFQTLGSLEDTHVLIVEDIVDTGATIERLVGHFEEHRPKSVEICALLYKPGKIQTRLPVKFVGFEIPDEFVVGYGLDYKQTYRNLPFVGVLNA